MRVIVALVTLLALARPAAAQSTYIGASLVGDIGRYDQVGYDDIPRPLSLATTLDGEALGFNLRIGRELGRRWGVEFEFARSGEMENSFSQAMPAIRLLTSLPVIFPPLPEFEYEVETEQRHTSYGTLAWYRQSLGDTFDLTYLAGIAFTRTTIEQEVSIADGRLAIFEGLPDSRTTMHSVAPAVGAEAAFRLNESAAVTGGVRLHGSRVAGRGGWLVRPNVGVRWTF